ncbi:MAG: hypothetical protein K0R57_400 [Paenibacillaceae bacterium]|jgi:uncharacterized protein YjdB|nr:hypothetical protein [Paenibacillaceae bacterium]
MRVMKRTVLLTMACLLSCLLLLWAAVKEVRAEEEPLSTGYLLDEDFFFPYDREPGEVKPSGWDLKRAGGSLSYSYGQWFKITDSSTILPVAMSKKFVPQTEGSITLEYRFKPGAIMDGLQWQLLDNDLTGFCIATQGNSLGLVTPSGEFAPLQTYAANTEYGVKVAANLDSMTADVYVNGILRAAGAPFAAPVGEFNRFQVQTGAAATGEMFFGPLRIYTGYTVNESLISTVPGFLPEDWSASGSAGSVELAELRGSTAADRFSVKLDGTASSGGVTWATYFPVESGELKLEFKLMIPVKTDGFSVALTEGSMTPFKMVVKDGKLGYLDAAGQPVHLYEYSPNLWYDVRLEVDTVHAKAALKLNGKLLAENLDIAPFASGADGIAFYAPQSANGIMYADDVLLYKKMPEPEDYVPEPMAVSASPYLLGAQSCPIWREGHHIGWDAVAQDPVRMPYLGYYDEGNPETADWEIKWMVEHGIDFQLGCWFRPQGSQGQPIKDPYLDYALHDGFFNAKYSGRMKFAILWENGGGSVKDSADFRNHIVPYWLEYYFNDPRYLVIDNKPVLSIFHIGNLIRDFGGTVAGAKAEIDYLRNAVQAAGFDDIIVLTSFSAPGADEIGIDAVYSYSWSSMSGHEQLQKANMLRQSEESPIEVLTTLSMGREDTTWGGKPGYYASVEEFRSLSEWARDSFMPAHNEGSLGQKLVMLDNWNEFGEGHYLMPSNLEGFGYLDVLRDVFTDGGAHEDTRPTSGQLRRISTLYPEGRTVPLLPRTPPAATETAAMAWEFITDGDTEGWSPLKQIDGFGVSGGKLHGVSTGSDPGIVSRDHLGVEAVDAPYIRLEVPNGTVSGGQLFFITETDGVWNEAKSIRFFAEPSDSGASIVLLDMWKLAKWSGTIRSLRIDPLDAAGSFGLDSIRIISSPAAGMRLYVDGNSSRYVVPRLSDDDVPMVPAEAVYRLIGGSSEWEAAGQQLTAVKGGTVVRFTSGSSTVLVNGSPALMESEAAFDGSDMMVPASFFSQVLGYGVSWKEGAQSLFITTASPAWGFATGDEGWAGSGQIANMEAGSGYWKGISTGSQPELLSPDWLNVDTSSVHRIRLSLQNNTASVQAAVYYTTREDAVWDESKKLTVYILPSDGKYREYVLDTTAVPGWTGTLKQLKLIPVTGAGAFSLDSITLDTSMAIPLKGDNLIADPGMENDDAVYSGSGSTQVLSEAEAHSGHQSLKITKSAAFGNLSHPVPLVPNEVYEYSVWAKLDAGSANNELLRIVLDYHVDGARVQKLVLTSAPLSKTEWKQVKGTFSIQETGAVTGTRLFMYTDNPNTEDAFYVDDAELRKITAAAGPAWTHVTGISMKPAVSLYEGYTEQLMPTLLPANAINREVLWTSSAPEAAIVDESGVVYGKEAGTAVIQALALDGGFAAQTVVEVIHRTPVAGIGLDRTSITLPYGQSDVLTALFTPADASDQQVSWSSSNSASVTVDTYGHIAAVQEGTAVITVKSRDGGYAASAVVTVPVNRVLGSNLVTDPGMEGSTPHYSGYNITRELSTAEAYEGLQSLRITKAGGTANIGFPAAIQRGKEYYYSAWVKLAPGSAQGEVLRICLQYKVDGVNKQMLILTGPNLSLTEWKRTEGFYTIEETGAVTEVKMFMYTDLPALADSYYLDNVEIRPVSYLINPVPVTGISLSKTELTIGVGATGQLAAAVEPQNATDGSILWSSDNPEVAAVSVTGAVYGKSEGTAVIMATTVDGGKTAVCTVSVIEGFSETVTLTVKPDGTGDFLSPKLANDSIQDSQPQKQYVILIYPGVYTEKNWTVKPYTTLRGTDREQVWLKGENSPTATNSEITNQSTLWLKATANLENLTVTAKNMRYPVHSEDSGNNRDAVHHVKNVHIEHYGNLEAVQYRQSWMTANPGITPPDDLNPANVWGGSTGVGSHAWGYGSASGVVETFEDSVFISKATGWYVHNREDFTKPQINTVQNSRIVSLQTGMPIVIQSLGSGTDDEVIFSNSEITGTYMMQNDSPWITQRQENQYANHADYKVTFINSTPVGYLDGHRGRALALFSNSAAGSSYVRVGGSAVQDILGEYETRDGGGGLQGYLYGYWDISGIMVGLNSNIQVNNTLGRRLGDCTSNSKIMEVTFQGEPVKTIVFNEDYTTKDNSYVLGKINQALGSSGVALEYNVTLNEYYPQVPDKQLMLLNNTDAGIPRFAAVCFDSSDDTLRLMTAADSPESFIGITLERIAPGGSGRVLTEGVMRKNQLYGFTEAISTGTRISIGAQPGSLRINNAVPGLLEGTASDWAYFKGRE